MTGKPIQYVRWLFLGLLLTSMPLAGCGGDNKTATQATARASLQEVCEEFEEPYYQDCAEGYAAAQQAEEGEEAGPETSPSEPAPMHLVATLQLRSEEGYAAKAILRRGRIEHADSGMANGELLLGSGCAVNDQQDAAQAFELTITNTTHGYSASPGVNIFGRAPDYGPPGVNAEVSYNEVPACRELRSDASPVIAEDSGYYVSLSPAEPLEPGDSVSMPGFFIIPDYYSPAHPSGDRYSISNSILDLAPQLGGENFSIERASGVLNTDWYVAAVPVLPGSDGGCLAHPPCPPAFKTE